MESGYTRKKKNSQKTRDGQILPPIAHRKHARTSVEGMREIMDKQVRHIENALAHRGHKPTKEQLTEFRTFLKGAIAAVQPFNSDASPRPEGNMDLFFRFGELFVRTCAVLLPYETPRLAAIAYRRESEDTDMDQKDYQTVEELRITLTKRGLPVDHLIESDRRLAAAERDADEG